MSDPDTTLLDHERTALRALADSRGESAACGLCLVSRATLQRALAGSPVRRAQLAAIRRALAEQAAPGAA